MNKINQLIEHVSRHPTHQTADIAMALGLSPRRIRELKVDIRARGLDTGGHEAPLKDDTLSRLLSKNGLSVGELTTILESARTVPGRVLAIDLGRTGKFRFLVVSDTHIGQKKFDQPTWDLAVRVLKRDNCEFVLHPGDHLEGMSGRPGHVYELSHIGFQAQKERCLELYRQISVPIYGIDGNHDQWYAAKGDSGLIVGKQLEVELPNFHHLGEWEGQLTVSGVKIMLFHANDGTAYSNSYKGQKLIESLLIQEKPQLLFEGHYHKALYQYIRGIHQWEAGTVCRQTGFMRGKKLAAHVGFWRIEVEHQAGKVIGVESKWYSLPEFE